MRQLLTAVLLLAAIAAGQWPDRGGYRFLDSDTAAGPVFQWVDISSTGTRVALGDDDNAGPFALGETFTCYWRDFDSVRICSNGWLSFASNSHQFHHLPVPDPRDPNALVAPCWTDLDPAQGGAVYYLRDTLRRRFVVSWVNVPHHGVGDSLTFQAVLDCVSGEILFQYLDLPSATPAGESCSVGIEDDSGAVGSEYFFDGTPPGARLHDSLAVRFYQLDYDACPVSILEPLQNALAGDTIVPLVHIWNAGVMPATFPVTLRIGDDYRREIAVTGLPPLADSLLEFPPWVPGEDSYPVQLFTGLPGDEFTANDTLSVLVTGSYLGELRYDDGEPDTSFLRNGAPNADWAAAVRFTPPYAAFRLVRGLVQPADTRPFSRVLICPDSAGCPRLGAPYAHAESVSAAGPGQWLTLEADTIIAGGGALWLVAFWPRGASGPRIGEDRDPPLDGHSWYGSPAVRWLPYTAGDLLMRLEIDGRAGIEEPGTAVGARGIAPLATVVRGSLNLTSDISNLASDIVLIDAAGRRVLSLKPGLNDVSSLAPGVYFVRQASSAKREASSVTRVVIAD